jgi:hypothetical protein
MTKQEEFDHGVTELMEKLGAVSLHEDFYPCTLLHTQAGPLHIKPMGDWVAMQFEYPKLAVEKVGGFWGPLNQYSGKWNFHSLSGKSVDWELKMLENRLRMVLVWVPEMEEEEEK